MNFSTSDMHSFWDISAQQPDSFSALPDDDFLAFLQKQFPGAVGQNPPLSFDGPDGVNPQSINSFPPPSLSSPSSDSSPSPPSTHNESSVSRRQSGVFNNAASESPQQQHAQIDDSSLKRKASNDNDDEPQSKSQHTSSSSASSKKTTSSASARRKPGQPQDETRLLKRKEQNRAAQRAFRERKEKHVRDLEDKVAALEAKNQLTEQENENLRDLLQRLQNENMMLKQAAFTFTAPRNTNDSNNTQSSFNNHPMTFNFATPGAGPSKPPMQAQSPPSTFDFNNNFNSLISFDPSAFDDVNDSMDMDAPFSHNANQYKTIASNPNYMSFAEPSPADSPQMMLGGGSHYVPMNIETFGDSWSSPDSGSQDPLDQLFGGGFMSSGGGVDFQALLASPPSALSPAGRGPNTPSLSSSISSPAGGTNSASPQTMGGASPLNNKSECPRTKEEIARKIAEEGQSSFVQSPSMLGDGSGSPAAGGDAKTDDAAGPTCEMPFPPLLRKSAGEGGGAPFVMCRGSSFPKTQKSDKNVEVLTAWRTITSNPQFKDVDINELCTEFTNKARCDGTKVVLEPEGVHHIIETLAARQAANQAKQQQQQ